MAVRYDFAGLAAEAKAQGLTQTAVARRARITQQRVSKFFLGKQQGPETAGRIAKALGVELRDFLIVLEERAAS